MLLVSVIYRLICAACAAAIASRKGRSTVGWFFGGFFLGVVGIIIVAVISNRKELETERRRTAEERRRLREQLRQEKMKNEGFRKYTMGRLDSHDKALGMDTRPADALLTGPAEQGQAGAKPLPEPDDDKAVWYYELQGAAKGPVTRSDIKAMLLSKTINGSTLVWTEDLGEWTPVSRTTLLRNEAEP